MEFNHHRPIYLQIKEELCRMIAREELSPGGKVPSVREMAQRMQVNPNTVQRAYREMEEENLFFTRRGQGTFITETPEALSRLRMKLARAGACDYARVGRSLGLDRETMQRLLQEAMEREGL